MLHICSAQHIRQMVLSQHQHPKSSSSVHRGDHFEICTLQNPRNRDHEPPPPPAARKMDAKVTGAARQEEGEGTARQLHTPTCVCAGLVTRHRPQTAPGGRRRGRAPQPAIRPQGQTATLLEGCWKAAGIDLCEASSVLMWTVASVTPKPLPFIRGTCVRCGVHLQDDFPGRGF